MRFDRPPDSFSSPVPSPPMMVGGAAPAESASAAPARAAGSRR